MNPSTRSTACKLSLSDLTPDVFKHIFSFATCSGLATLNKSISNKVAGIWDQISLIWMARGSTWEVRGSRLMTPLQSLLVQRINLIPIALWGCNSLIIAGEAVGIQYTRKNDGERGVMFTEGQGKMRKLNSARFLPGPALSASSSSMTMHTFRDPSAILDYQAGRPTPRRIVLPQTSHPCTTLAGFHSISANHWISFMQYGIDPTKGFGLTCCETTLKEDGSPVHKIDWERNPLEGFGGRLRGFYKIVKIGHWVFGQYAGAPVSRFVGFNLNDKKKDFAFHAEFEVVANNTHLFFLSSIKCSDLFRGEARPTSSKYLYGIKIDDQFDHTKVKADFEEEIKTEYLSPEIAERHLQRIVQRLSGITASSLLIVSTADLVFSFVSTAATHFSTLRFFDMTHGKERCSYRVPYIDNESYIYIKVLNKIIVLSNSNFTTIFRLDQQRPMLTLSHDQLHLKDCALVGKELVLYTENSDSPEHSLRFINLGNYLDGFIEGEEAGKLKASHTSSTSTSTSTSSTSTSSTRPTAASATTKMDLD